MKSGNLKRFFKKLKPKSKLEKELAKLSAERFQKENAALSELCLENPFIENVKQIDFTQFYDSTWLIETADGNVKIIRREMETMESICEVLKTVSTITDIKSLDERDRIYYD